jgi:hypothetical protein
VPRHRGTPLTKQYERIPSAIHTFTGRMVDPLDLKPGDLCVEDIAHALANQCRFSGHVRTFYSVAQHCVIASRIVAKGFEYDALMHDAAEAYLQDMAKPLKNHPKLGQAYRGAEQRIERTIGEVFGVRFPFPPEVKEADLDMLVTEARDLMHGTSGWSGSYRDRPPLALTITGWSPKRAEEKFLARYYELREAA